MAKRELIQCLKTKIVKVKNLLDLENPSGRKNRIKKQVSDL